MISPRIFGVPTDGLNGNRCIDGEMGQLNVVLVRKTFALTSSFHVLVWRANGSKR